MGLAPFPSMLDITHGCFILPLLSKFMKNHVGHFAVHTPLLKRFNCFEVLATKSGLFLSDREWLRMFKVADRKAPFKND